jgi:rhodanese-related sulfurtransferase
MRTIFAGLAALALVLTSAAALRADEPKAAEKYPYPDVSIKELKSAIEKKEVVLIDANGTDSWKDGHIPGAIDFEATGEKLEKVLPKDKDALIVAYCGGPQCMAYQAAAKKAKALGYTNVRHLSAGISGWKGAGEKVEKGESRAS